VAANDLIEINSHVQLSLSTYIAEGYLSQIVPSYESIPLPTTVS
jgi:hypothetical protein